MSQSMFLFGTKSKLAALLNLLAARAQDRGPVVFIDPVGVFDAEYVLDAQGDVANVSLCRPRTAYQLRALLDTKLPRAHEARAPFLVIVSCVAHLFDPVDVNEREFVVEYAFESLKSLVDPQGSVVFATSVPTHAAARQMRALCDISIDVERVEKSARAVPSFEAGEDRK